MDFLNNAYQQILETFRPMSTSAKITTGLLLAAVVVGVTMLFQFEPMSGDEYLLGAHVFSQEELSVALAAFANAQLNDYAIENYRIRVPKSQRHKYVAAMASENAMPKTTDDDWLQMLNGGILESSETRKFRDRYRKTRALERTLAEVTGVKYAKVEFNVQPAATLMGQPTKSALVAVTPLSNAGIDAKLVKSIRTTAAYFLNMDSEKIAILDTRTGLAYKGDTVGPGAFGEDEYSAYKSIRENELTQKLYDQLSHIPGVKLNVQIELGNEVRHEIETFSVKDKPTPLITSTTTEEESTSDSGPQGRPGVATNNTGNLANSAATVASNSKESIRNVSREEQKSIVGQERTRREMLPFSPKNVTVSVSVPRSHISAVWTQLNPTAEGEEAKKPSTTDLAAIESSVSTNIEELVNNLLPPLDATLDPFPRVTVKVVNDLPQPALKGPAQGALVMDWLQDNWSKLGMGLLGLIGLVFLRGMLKAGSADNAAAGLAGPGSQSSAGSPGGVGDSSEAPGGAAQVEDEFVSGDDGLTLKDRYKREDGPNLRDELADIVREDPDAAASVLSVWIGDRA